MSRKKVEIKRGDRYGMLTVLEEVEPHICPSGRKVRRFNCKCDCGNTTIVFLDDLRRGHTQSCGCLRKQIVSEIHSKTNEYDLSGEIGIGYTSNGERFLFDKEDYDIIKKYCWYIANGYVATAERITGKTVMLHRLIMNAEKDEVVDHINHVTTNNCKSNLRVCEHEDNMKNRGIHKNNTSGVVGIAWYEQRKKWRATIMVNGKYKHLGYFTSKEEAVKARIKSEIELFGEFSANYNKFTEEQRKAILNDTMQTEEIFKILQLNQDISQCI